MTAADIQAQFEAFKVAAEARDAEVHERLDAVRSHLRIANEMIEKQRRELERFRPVTITCSTVSHDEVKVGDEWVSTPVTLYAKDDHA